MARPAGRPSVLLNEIVTGVHSSVSNCLLTARDASHCWRSTVSQCNFLAVRFSSSAIFFIGEFFGDDLASYRNSSICCGICESPQQRLYKENLRLASRRRCGFCQITLTFCLLIAHNVLHDRHFRRITRSFVHSLQIDCVSSGWYANP